MSDPVSRLNAALEGRYRIQAEIGEGGMATVYVANDLRHERRVALKVLKPELAAVLGSERFLAEIRTTANLQHPNILPLFDSGEADGFLYYVMPRVDGESLRDRLAREKQLPVDEAVQIAKNVAEALDYAHRQGVIHRDIKPGNILLHDGKAVVTDFGIALAGRDATSGTRLTETGVSLGTPVYASPEQASGDRDVGPTADVYSLGCVLYEMLVGEPPYTGRRAHVILAKIMAGPPASPTAHRSSVPSHIDAAVMKALQRVPSDRFPSARSFLSALNGPVASARKATPRWRVAVGLGALGTAVAILAVLNPGSRSSYQATIEPLTLQKLTNTGTAMVWSGTPLISPNGEFVASFDSDDRSLRVTEVTGAGAWVPDLSLAFGTLAWSLDGRSIYGWGWFRVGDRPLVGVFEVPRFGGSPRVLSATEPSISGTTDTTYDIVVSDRCVSELRGTLPSSGPGVGASDPRLQILCHRLDELGDTTSKDFALQQYSHGNRVHHLRLSPNSDWVLALEQGTTSVLKVRSTEDGLLSDSLTLEGRQPVWSADGRHVLFLSGDPTRLSALSFDSVTGTMGRLPVTLAVLGVGVSAFSVSASLERVALIQRFAFSNIWMGAVEGDSVEGFSAVTTGTADHRTPALSYDGARIAFWRDGTLVVAPASSPSAGRSVYDARGAEPLIYDVRPEWSSDSQRLAFVDDGGAVVLDPETALARPIDGPLAARVLSVAWLHQESQTVALLVGGEFADQASIWLHDLSTGDSSLLVEGIDGGIGAEPSYPSLMSSPDGGRLVYQSVRRRMVSVDIGTGAQEVIQQPRGRVLLDWLRDGSLLAWGPDPAFWALIDTSGRVLKRLQIPSVCEALSVNVSPHRDRITCTVEQEFNDVFVGDIGS